MKVHKQGMHSDIHKAQICQSNISCIHIWNVTERFMEVIESQLEMNFIHYTVVQPCISTGFSIK